MTLETAYEKVYRKFPLKNYLGVVDESYINIAYTVQRYLKPGDRIFDFGSGACNKTAIVQLLGFPCTAYDDLSDLWHIQDKNRERIIQFAKDFGIEFILA